MALVAMAFLWTGSQIPAYLYGGVPPYSKLAISFKIPVTYKFKKFMEILEVQIDGRGSSWVIYSHLARLPHSLVVCQISLDVAMSPFLEVFSL